jgi:hypothetical protein
VQGAVRRWLVAVSQPLIAPLLSTVRICGPLPSQMFRSLLPTSSRRIPSVCYLVKMACDPI